MNDFEDLLKKRFPTGNMKDEEIIMDMTFELKDNEPLKQDKSAINAQFANGNAQLRDFFEMVGFICESAMDDLNIQYLPYEQALLYEKDSDFRMNKNTIAYKAYFINNVYYYFDSLSGESHIFPIYSGS